MQTIELHASIYIMWSPAHRQWGTSDQCAERLLLIRRGYFAQLCSKMQKGTSFIILELCEASP
jgi:hypothetical protein